MKSRFLNVEAGIRRTVKVMWCDLRKVQLATADLNEIANIELKIIKKLDKTHENNCLKAMENNRLRSDLKGYDPWENGSPSVYRPESTLGSLSPLQGHFPPQGSNPGLPHCRRILYQPSHQGSPEGYVYLSVFLRESIATVGWQRVGERGAVFLEKSNPCVPKLPGSEEWIPGRRPPGVSQLLT